MSKFAFVVDGNGFVIDTAIITKEQEKEQEYVTVSFPIEPLLSKPRWDGTQWIEGETEEEKSDREDRQLLESLRPSPTEIADAELEIKMITMLAEMGVIQ